MYLVYVHILISLGGKRTVSRSASRMSWLPLSICELAGNASSGFKVLFQDNNSFITVLLVSSPRFVTSVEDKMKIRLSDKQQIGSIQPCVTEYDETQNSSVQKKGLFRQAEQEAGV